MSEPVDELFGGQGAQRRERTILGLLAGGLITAIFGLLFSSVPGGLMVLGAWMMAEGDLEAIQAGYLPEEVRPEAQRLRWWTLVGLSLILIIFVAQGVLMSMGFYDLLWIDTLEWLVAMGSDPSAAADQSPQ